MAAPAFPEITKIAYEGPKSKNHLSFRWYNPDEVVEGRTMKDHLRFAVVYWHTFRGTGSDPFGPGTMVRPWEAAQDSVENACNRARVAFEFMEKLQAPFYCFHDRDIAPEGATLAESNAILDRITEKTMGALLGKYVGAGDIVIDLAWNIDACEILDWCHKKGVMYINTSTELWDPYASGPKAHPTTKTLYWRHMNVRRMMAKWKTKGPTAVLEHGANPGLISHFTKQGLLDIAAASLADKKFKGKKAELIAELAQTQAWNHLAHQLGAVCENLEHRERLERSNDELRERQPEHVETDVRLELRVTHGERLAVAEHHPLFPLSRCRETEHQPDQSGHHDAQLAPVPRRHLAHLHDREVLRGVGQGKWCQAVGQHQVDPQEDRATQREDGSEFQLAAQDAPVHVGATDAVEPHQVHEER